VKQPEWCLSTISPLANITKQMIQAGSSYRRKKDWEKPRKEKIDISI